MAESHAITRGVDTATVARIAGVDVGTLNVWIGRNLIPFVAVGTRGRARIFDLDTLVHISIMAALVRLSYAAPFASSAAWRAREGYWERGAKLLIASLSPSLRARLGHTPTAMFFGHPDPTMLDQILDRVGRPEVYTVVEANLLAERAKKGFMNPESIEELEQQSTAFNSPR
jgi:hypothetical protein